MTPGFKRLINTVRVKGGMSLWNGSIMRNVVFAELLFHIIYTKNALRQTGFSQALNFVQGERQSKRGNENINSVHFLIELKLA